MNQLVAFTDRAPTLVATAGKCPAYRFFEFFTRFPACQKGPHGSAHGWHC
jgi:hypothetical protein